MIHRIVNVVEGLPGRNSLFEARRSTGCFESVTKSQENIFNMIKL